MGRGDAGEDAWWPVIRGRLDDPQWAETIELFPACLLQHGESHVEKLLRRIAGLRGKKPTLAEMRGSLRCSTECSRS